MTEHIPSSNRSSYQKTSNVTQILRHIEALGWHRVVVMTMSWPPPSGGVGRCWGSWDADTDMSRRTWVLSRVQGEAQWSQLKQSEPAQRPGWCTWTRSLGCPSAADRIDRKEFLCLNFIVSMALQAVEYYFDKSQNSL